MSTIEKSSPGPIVRRVASSRRKNGRFKHSPQPNTNSRRDSAWIDNSFMSGIKKNGAHGTTPSKRNQRKLPPLLGTSTPKSGTAAAAADSEAPCSPDLFADSFNDHDSFFEKIDIVEIEKKASQETSDTATDCDAHTPHKSTHADKQIITSKTSKTPAKSRKRKYSSSQEVIDVQPKASKDSPRHFFASDSSDAFLSNLDAKNISHETNGILDECKKQQSRTCGKHTERVINKTSNSDSTPNVRTSESIGQETSPQQGTESIADNSKERTGTTTTPGSASARLNRLKKTLQKNATTTPQNPQRLQQYREEQVENALKDAKIIQSEGGEFDIGPFYGLPSHVQKLFEEQRGITTLYDWQHECLSLPAVREGRNLIYSLPTSGGKTLVAEILMLRQLLCRKRDAVFVMPFVALVQEKVRILSKFAVELDFLVEEYAGSKGAFPPRKRRGSKSIYVATIEKANSLVNSLIEAGRTEELGLVVVDELHMLGEGGSRGATLEMCLSKLLHAVRSCQIVAMSATLSNIGDLSRFLRADVYSNDFRPVELTEYVKLQDTLYAIHPTALCPDDRLKHDRVTAFKSDKASRAEDPDQLTGLVMEVVPQHSCLIFCATKKNCENVAKLLCKLMPSELQDVKQAERRSLVRQLREDGAGEICPVLRRTVPYGVAYHHSGLTTDERRLLEDAYLEGVLNVVCCTSTLAAGVNLPAKRVIVRSPYVGSSFLSRSQYKQMVGRAGRAGLDSSGESILVLQPHDKHKLLDLVCGAYDECSSSLLYADNKGVRAMMLTTVGLKLTPCPASVSSFLQCTLCHAQASPDTDLAGLATSALQQLRDLGLVIQTRSQGQDDEMKLEVTNLGRAVFKGSVDIDRGKQLYEDLCQAREALCVENYLHLLYLVTPYDMVDNVTPHWMTYLDEFSLLSPTEQKVAASIGVTEAYIAKKASGQRVRKGVNERVYVRWYLALILYRLWRQQSVWQVAARFQLGRGLVQQLLSGAAAFAACITHFCKELEEFWAYQDLLTNFVRRLTYCVTMELIALVEIPGVKMGRARQLYNAGFRTLSLLAHADPGQLVQSIQHLSRKAAGQIVASAQMLLKEKAEALREEAEDLISVPSVQPHIPSRVAMETNSQSSLDTAAFDSQFEADLANMNSQASVANL